MLLPTGPGESQFAKIEGMHFDGVEWFPDNKRILFTGNETGHQQRTWIYDLETNKTTPATPEGTRGMRISPDGQWFVTVDPHKLLLTPVGGGNSKTVVDLQNGESVARWSGDGRYLFLQQREPASIKISRLEIATHRKEPWLVVKLPSRERNFSGRWLCRPTGRLARPPFNAIWRICSWCEASSNRDLSRDRTKTRINERLPPVADSDS